MHPWQPARTRHGSLPKFGLAAFLAAILLLGSCAPKVLVEDYRLENAAIGFSMPNPLKVQVGSLGYAEPAPSKIETADCIRRANYFAKWLMRPLGAALRTGLQQSNVKVFDIPSPYRLAAFMTGLQPKPDPAKMDDYQKSLQKRNEAFLESLREQEMASGQAQDQPDSMLNLHFREIAASPGRHGHKDHYTIYIEATVVTIKGPGKDKGPVWKKAFHVDALPTRTNDLQVANEIARQVLDGLKAAKLIPS